MGGGEALKFSKRRFPPHGPSQTRVRIWGEQIWKPTNWERWSPSWLEQHCFSIWQVYFLLCKELRLIAFYPSAPQMSADLGISWSHTRTPLRKGLHTKKPWCDVCGGQPNSSFYSTYGPLPKCESHQDCLPCGGRCCSHLLLRPQMDTSHHLRPSPKKVCSEGGCISPGLECGVQLSTEWLTTILPGRTMFILASELIVSCLEA